eukprot:TRINITY_DN10466_c0_g1_i1.p1 TRINITY_DN10466_c0_g1~~TRINITY_DN10466_c0_g1_i1.p1  ORF type:complete len:269 (+),score=45.59 TRINITY_DN10466_c0_g1_i1:20-826(+)
MTTVTPLDNSGLSCCGHCAVGVVRSPEGLKGNTVTIKGSDERNLNVYVTRAGADEGKAGGKAVIVVHDIFGYNIPNCKFIVDYLAKEGFDAVLPDFYREIGGWDPASGIGTDPKWAPWFASVTSPEFEAKYLDDVKATKEYLKSLGNTSVGVVGFCWGGKAATNASRSGLVQAAVSLHGGRHGPADVTDSKCPVMFITVEGDRGFNKETQDEIRKTIETSETEGKIVVYGDGMYHGFVVRGDYENDAKLKAKADEAMGETTAWLRKYL